MCYIFYLILVINLNALPKKPLTAFCNVFVLYILMRKINQLK